MFEIYIQPLELSSVYNRKFCGYHRDLIKFMILTEDVKKCYSTGDKHEPTRGM